MVKVLRVTRTTMQDQSMSSVAIARKLEEFERDRAGGKHAARRNLAGKLKVGIARQGGARLDSDQVGEIEAHLEQARSLLGGKG